MSEEQEGTLNDDAQSSGADETLNETGEPSAPKESGELVSTTAFEYVPPEEEKTETQVKEAKTEGDNKKTDEEGKEKDQKSSEAVPYDRFEKVVSEKNELLERALKAEAALESGGKPDQDKGRSEVTQDQFGEFQDVSAMSDKQIEDMIDDEPLNFFRNLATQIQYETVQLVDDILKQRDERRATESAESEKQTLQERIKQTHVEYAKGNPDFNDMLDSGELKKFIDENPGHNYISAHQLLTAENRIAEAIEQARSETEQRKDKEFKTKRSVTVLTPGKTITGASKDSELKDTKKHGGLTNVLARRLAERRRAS